VARLRFDQATRAGRPGPMFDKTNIKKGFLETDPTEPFYEEVSNAYSVLHLWVNNTTGVDQTWSLYIVPAGGDKEDQWAIRSDVPLAPKESISEPEAFVIESGDQVFVEASNADAVTAFANLEMMG